MKIDVGKFVIVAVYLGVMVVGDGFRIQKRIQTLTAKANELFVGKPNRGDDDGKKMKVWNVDRSGDDDGDGINNDDKSDLPYWKNWWVIIAGSLLMPFLVFYTMRLVNSRLVNVQQLLQWPESFVPREKSYAIHRQPTLPDLTLARHARRESLAESAKHMTKRPRKVSHCIAELRKMAKKSAEKNEDPLGDTKRAHIIRRRH